MNKSGKTVNYKLKVKEEYNGMKRILLLFIAVCLIAFTACSAKQPDEEKSEDALEISDYTEESSAAAVQAFLDGRFDGREKIKLVAVGDSIARGYGLENPATQAYPAILSESLKAVLDGVEIDYMNLAVDGMKTDGCLELLQRSKMAVKDADLITVCIGANNVLRPFISSLGTVGGFISGGETDDYALETFIDKTNALLNSESFVKEMQKGIEQTARELPLILQTLKEYAPQAIITVTTVYSPYHGIVLSVPYLGKSVNMGEVSDKWVSLLNEVIKSAVDKESCVLVDSYSSFAESNGLVNASFSLVPLKLSFDPHPNINGHMLLSNLHLKALSSDG